MRFPLVTLVALALGCATTHSEESGCCDGDADADAKPVAAVISIQGLSCAECGGELVEIARGRKGVRSAEFDMAHAELHLSVAPALNLQSVVDAVQAHPIDGKPITATIGAGQGKYAPFSALDPKWDAQIVVTDGSDVELAKVLAAGKVTVVDFFADWCGPCHDLDDHVHALLAKDPALAYRRINVVSWETPVAKHYLADAKELPYVIVFDPHGKELARIAGDHAAELDAAVQKGEHP